ILNACSETAANITSISRPCDGIFPFHSALDLLRVVRVNLEQNLLQLGNTLLAPQAPISSSPRATASQISRKLPIGPLFYLFQRINIGLLESNRFFLKKNVRSFLSDSGSSIRSTTRARTGRPIDRPCDNRSSFSFLGGFGC
uniref:Uncharacterized protein n=1 Tax=Ciona savignyi TaxID=51511 RepID=H2YAT6_CIOSA